MFKLNQHDDLVGELHFADWTHANLPLVHLAFLYVCDVGELGDEIELFFSHILRHVNLKLLMAVHDLAEDGSFLAQQFDRFLVLEHEIHLQALKYLLESHLHEAEQLLNVSGLEHVSHGFSMLGKFFDQWVLILLPFSCASRIRIIEVI